MYHVTIYGANISAYCKASMLALTKTVGSTRFYLAAFRSSSAEESSHPKGSPLSSPPLARNRSRFDIQPCQVAPNVKLYQHLVGSGKQVEVTEAFVGDKLDLLRRFLRGRGQEVMDSALETGKVSVHVFLRAKVDLEVFHSVEYLRTRSQCSHHVCYQLMGDDASTRRYGRVLRYYKMQETLAQGTFSVL